MKSLKSLKVSLIFLIISICSSFLMMLIGFKHIFQGRIVFGTVEVTIIYSIIKSNLHSISRIKKIIKSRVKSN